MAKRRETYTLDSRGSSDVVCAANDGFGIRDTAGVSGELDSRRLRALGNAVCVHVVRWIADRLVSEESGITSAPLVHNNQETVNTLGSFSR